MSGESASAADARIPGSYHVVRDAEAEAVMSWQYICDTLSHGDLDELQRHKSCDDAYRAWAPSVKSQYGGLENYIRQTRLGWPAEQYTGPALPNMLDRPQKTASLLDPASAATTRPNGSAVPASSGACTPNGTKVVETWPEKTLPHPRKPDMQLKHFVADVEIPEDPSGSLVKTIYNDWPYGVPADARHWVVWCKLPIIHRSLFDDTSFLDHVRQRGDPVAGGDLVEQLYDCVTGDGGRGFTGFVPSGPTYTAVDGSSIPEVNGNVTRSILTDPASGVTPETASLAHHHAGRHIRQYITAKWPPQEYLTAWFCNPPGLRTVPGLSHFQYVTLPPKSWSFPVSDVRAY